MDWIAIFAQVDRFGFPDPMDKISKSADKAGAEYFVIKGFNTVGNGSQSSPANVNLEKSDSFAPSFFS
ncbi:DUF1471 domain-containing protein [Erwinia tracheiphila]|uniref:DUF1471 domain-containing protein n=1 Tax=Erwinia tracheiphila TaxID=65700 RepID=UPI001F2B7C49|nr:DUF1471 domain-containing protein [Erwinia tracheiphila]UIA92176.1 DUF1471 domain-containing protein [Erwinia tracheiphila]